MQNKKAIAVPIDIETPREENRKNKAVAEKLLVELNSKILADLDSFADEYVWLQATQGPLFKHSKDVHKVGYYKFSVSEYSGVFTLGVDGEPLMKIRTGLLENGPRNSRVFSLGWCSQNLEGGSFESFNNIPLKELNDYSDIEKIMSRDLNLPQIVKIKEMDAYVDAQAKAKAYLAEVEAFLKPIVSEYSYYNGKSFEEIEYERKEKSHSVGLYSADSDSLFVVTVDVNMEGKTLTKVTMDIPTSSTRRKDGFQPVGVLKDLLSNVKRLVKNDLKDSYLNSIKEIEKYTKEVLKILEDLALKYTHDGEKLTAYGYSESCGLESDGILLLEVRLEHDKDGPVTVFRGEGSGADSRIKGKASKADIENFLKKLDAVEESKMEEITAMLQQHGVQVVGGKVRLSDLQQMVTNVSLKKHPAKVGKMDNKTLTAALQNYGINVVGGKVRVSDLKKTLDKKDASEQKIGKQITDLQRKVHENLIECEQLLAKATSLIEKGEKLSDYQYGFFNEDAKEAHLEIHSLIKEALRKY
jgi:hypothetical protein